MMCGRLGGDSTSRLPKAPVKKRILILTVHHGASHERVAKALRRALLDADPELTVEIADALEHTAKWFRFYYDSYLVPLKLWPGLWARIENAQHSPKSLFQFIAQFDPAAVVAVEVGTCELAALMKREWGARFELVAIPTGLDADRPWAQPEVRLYIVAAEETARELEAAGVSRKQIRTSGQPIDPAFGPIADRAQIRGKLGVKPDVPLLLMLFGGMGAGRPEVIARSLRQLEAPIEIVFIMGRNKNLEGRMRRLADGRPNWRVLGWVENMHDWMAAADLALSKPGASTVVEALASGLPMLAFDPLPGNERRACDWAVSRLLANRHELERLRRSALTHARPRAAFDAARAILELFRPAS
ncbi:MAG: hypothetical protein DMG21_08555 [Acidobacteria bacterium]|nr:MAG: hypothetical protein DMG21_08555 [Acidobacteriota bacterium]